MPRAKTAKAASSISKARYEQESMREPYGRGVDETDPQGERWSAPAKTKSAYPRNAPGKRKSDAAAPAKPAKKPSLQRARGKKR